MITREPVEYPPGVGRWQRLRLMARVTLGQIGRGVILAGRAIAAIPSLRRPRAWQAFLRQMYVAGIESLPVITVVAIFNGMILALQIGIELQRYNQEALIGSAVMLAMLRDMAPFITGLILAACVGAAMAAQLGTMTVNDEIAALEIMSIDPVRYLMTPRMAAMMVMTPLLSFYTCMTGTFGGAVVGMTQLNVTWAQYMTGALDVARSKDLFVGLFKALLYGIIIAMMACYEGFTASEGAVGVGQATRRAVISCFLLILIVGYFVTRICYFK